MVAKAPGVLHSVTEALWSDTVPTKLLYGFAMAAMIAGALQANAAPAPTAQPPAKTAAPSAPPMAAQAAGTAASAAVFPTKVNAKYAGQSAGKARMHTCLDQYHANKAAHANGGLEWIQKGGGYYSTCTKKLKG